MRIRYMGNKQQLAGEVAVFCESLRDGRRLVDLFGGMGSVAGAAAASAGTCGSTTSRATPSSPPAA
jgi:hypothetical protein